MPSYVGHFDAQAEVTKTKTIKCSFYSAELKRMAIVVPMAQRTWQLPVEPRNVIDAIGGVSVSLRLAGLTRSLIFKSFMSCYIL